MLILWKRTIRLRGEPAQLSSMSMGQQRPAHCVLHALCKNATHLCVRLYFDKKFSKIKSDASLLSQLLTRTLSGMLRVPGARGAHLPV